jgi:hypothetical protein
MVIAGLCSGAARERSEADRERSEADRTAG